jgi:hypothetical protein
MGNKGRVGYPSDVSDEEWAFVAPYLALCKEDAEQRDWLPGLAWGRLAAETTCGLITRESNRRDAESVTVRLFRSAQARSPCNHVLLSFCLRSFHPCTFYFHHL